MAKKKVVEQVEVVEEAAQVMSLPPVVEKVERIPYAVRNLQQSDNGGVECEIKHPEAGWIPFSAHPADKEQSTLDVFEYIIKNKINIKKLPVSPQVKVNQEFSARDLRNRELTRADMMINKIEDFEIEGDSKPWRQYRVALRNWPSTSDFPSVLPTAPDLKG